MTKYLVVARQPDSPMTHPAGSAEETVCAIAKHLMHYRGPLDRLMAIAANSKVATFAVLKDQAMCSIEVTKKTLETWRHEVTDIQAAINAFHSAKDHAENLLDRALADLDEAYASSESFEGYVPSDDISVYGVLEELRMEDLKYAFHRSLEEIYQFQVLKHQMA